MSVETQERAPSPPAAARSRDGARRSGVATLAVAVVIITLAALSMVVDSFQLAVLENATILAVFALGTNVLLGYGGLMSFGQACFYGLAAYFVALSWLHYETSFWLAAPGAILAATLLAVAVGAVALRAKKWYFALVTLGFSQLLFTVAQKWYDYTLGDNGVFGAIAPQSLVNPQARFIFVTGVAGVAVLFLWKIVTSPFGVALKAIREHPERAEALGMNVYVHRLLAFTISGAFSAVAGVLYVLHDQSAFPQLLNWETSAQPVLAAVIGGMSSFLGPLIGAVIYQYSHDLVVQWTVHWQLVLGAILLLVVIAAPDGAAGLLVRWYRWLRSQLRRDVAP